MALVSKAFGDIITFTRASTATFTGSNGLIQSAAIDAPRFDYDPVTLAAKGLLIEEQRTNIATYSEDFANAAWAKTNATANASATTSPSGALNGNSLIEDTATGEHHFQGTFTVTSAIAYTASVYVKATGSPRNLRLNLFQSTSPFTGIASAVVNTTTGAVISGTGTVENVGNGWFRVSVTGTTPTTGATLRVSLVQGTGTFSYTGDGTSGVYIWGAQLEAGAFATSYIPTVASQVTRSADVASVNTLSPWYNATEGTLFAEATPRISGYSPFAQIDDTTSSNRLLVEGGVDAQGFAVAGGVTQASLDLGATSANTTAKIAFAYKANDFAGSLDGGAVVTDTSGTIPTVSVLRFGANTVATYSCHIRRITYYPRRLSNAELQAITA